LEILSLKFSLRIRKRNKLHRPGLTALNLQRSWSWWRKWCWWWWWTITI